MVGTALNREPDDLLPAFFAVQETNEYLVGTTGAKATADSSIGVIIQYCNKLPKDKYGDHVSVLFLFVYTYLYL
jgi:endoribonuclease Dicer